MYGVSTDPTPITPTFTSLGAVPTVNTSYGVTLALSGSHVQAPPASFWVTLAEIIWTGVSSPAAAASACVIRSPRTSWPQSNSWLPNVAAS